MSVVAALLLYAGRVLRRPMDVRLKQRQGGPFLLVVLTITVLAVWMRYRPGGLPASYFYGELTGVLTVHLLSCSLVLATRARWLEPWFGGLDRMYLWHKWCALLGIGALPFHVLITGRLSPATPAHTPSTDLLGNGLGVLSVGGLIALVLISLPQFGQILRLPYQRWLFLHRFTGLLVLIALLHGLLLDRVIAGSGLLKVVYLVIGGAGMAAYAYTELVMRRRVPRGDYTVARITRLSEQVLELHLTPVARRVTPAAGQFIFLRIGGDDAWREHPFTVTGLSPDGELRLTIRSLGHDTTRMHARLQPGLPATVTGPYGMFDYTLGNAHQIWIAGGIGIAPFLSWLAELDSHAPYAIDLFYSTPTPADAVYLDELRAAQQRLAPLVRVHPVYSRTEGHLTGDKIADMVELAPDTHVFLCGPTAMVEALSRELHQAGVPRDYLHSEHFTFR